MKKIKLRMRASHDVDISKPFFAKIGGARGFDDACAIEPCSNELSPTLRCVNGFTTIVFPIDEQEDCESKDFGILSQAT